MSWLTRFDDFDFSADDAYLDAAFLGDEVVLGARGLVGGVPWRGRVPWDTILGQTARFEAGWERRGAPVMAPVGLVIHWTASKPTWLRPAPALGICRDGRDNIPGPLCHLHLDWRGRTTVLASGRANHAGMGDQSVLAALKTGRLTAGRPGPDTGGSGGSLIGIEVEHSGAPGVPYPPAVVAELTRLAERIRARYGWPANRAIDHARWTRRKIDCVTHRTELPPLRWLTGIAP